MQQFQFSFMLTPHTTYTLHTLPYTLHSHIQHTLHAPIYTLLYSQHKYSHTMHSTLVYIFSSRILQVKAAQVTVSEKYKAGYTLRFPRVIKIRTDKNWSDCMDLSGRKFSRSTLFVRSPLTRTVIIGFRTAASCKRVRGKVWKTEVCCS